MNQSFPKLFERGYIGKMEVKNRIVKAPTWTLLGARDGSVTPRIIEHYAEIARGGTGLVIVEFAYVDNKGSQSGVCQLGVYDDGFMPGLAQLAEGIKANGARAVLQISHCGKQRRLRVPPIKSPSRIPSEDFELRGAVVPEELTFEEIQEIISAFGDAARRAKMAGFDMVEVHGAHGYLPASFLSPRTNKRGDWYGGSPENRMRFSLQMAQDMRRKVGPDFPIGIRMNGTDFETDGFMLEDAIQVAKALEKEGVNIIHVSAGSYQQRLPRESTPAIPLGPLVYLAEAIKKEITIPVIASSSLNTPEIAESVLEKGQADFVALARQLLADPFWPRKAKENRLDDIVPCIRCNDGCHYRSQQQGRPILCTVNVALGRERDYAITPVKDPKKIAIIGGGPAGMEAARVSALFGHQVVIYEKRKLGGLLHEASTPDFKPDIKKLMNYYLAQMDKLHVEVVKKEASVAAINKGGFDAVIVAVGGTPCNLDVPGAEKPMVSNAIEILNGRKRSGNKVIVVGGGIVGVETGLFLAEQGKEVTFVEVLDRFMNGVEILDQMVYEKRLAKQKVTVYTGKRIESVNDDGAVIVDRFGKRQSLSADSIVVAIGFTPQTDFINQLRRETDINIYAAGDCLRPRKLFDAIQEGHFAARAATAGVDN